MQRHSKENIRAAEVFVTTEWRLEESDFVSTDRTLCARVFFLGGLGLGIGLLFVLLPFTLGE